MLERLAELTATMMWMVLPLGLLMTLVAVGVSAARAAGTSRSSRCNPSSPS